MKKVLITLLVFLVVGTGVFIFVKKTITNENEKTKKAKIKIEYTDALADENIKVFNELKVEYGTIKYLSNFISIENATFEDKEIIYSDLGEVKVNFEYTLDNKEYYRFINFDIVDTKEPLVSVPGYKTIQINSDISFVEDFFCADNYDKNVERYLDGYFDLGAVGTYPVKYIATDKAGNKVERDITLNVVEKIENNSSNNNSNKPINYLDYNELYKTYKTSNTKVGIDISRWQGDVDFDALKNSNVEFIMIRLGGQDGIDGEYYIDSKFTQNIKGALDHGFDVGVYFYSYAYTKEEAKKQAKYVIDNLKGYNITLYLTGKHGTNLINLVLVYMI